MPGPKRILNTILATLLLAACKPGNGTVKIEVQAQTPDKSPVASATVSLDDEHLGHTNAFGTFAASVSVAALTRHKITVRMEDSSHYYAPHFETFKVARGETLTLTIKPVLFVVPKPRAKLSTMRQEPAKSIAEGVNSVAGNELTASRNSGIPLITLSENDLTPVAASPAQTMDSHVMFTTHVYSGRLPLGDASVTFSQPDGYVNTCKTNDRGRCAITIQNGKTTTGSLLVQHQGFKSVLKDLTPSENANVRLSMEPGLTIDIKSVANGPWNSKPLPGAEIRLRGATVGITNVQGLAVFSPENGLPVSLRVESPLKGDVVELNVTNSDDANVLAKFSNNFRDGWTELRILPLHEKADVASNIPASTLTAIEASLSRESPAVKEFQGITRLTSLPAGALALLPVAEQSEKHVTLTLHAIDSSGVLASSGPIPVKSPLLAESWASATDEAKKSLSGRLPWPGTVTSIKNGVLSLAVNPKSIRVNDRVLISTDSRKLTATVTSVVAETIHARLDGYDGSVAVNGNIIGSVAAKIVPPNQKMAADVSTLATLKPVLIEDPGIRFAKKFLSENSPLEALNALSISGKSVASNILIRQMRASISQDMGETSAVIHELYDILGFATSSNLTFAALVTEANLLRAQTESMPVIARDSELAKRFEELAREALCIKSDLESRFMSRLAETNIIATLNYTHLGATRKKAESEGDEVTLATLGSQWDDFEKSLPLDNLKKPERISWSRVVSNERARVSLTSDLDRKSM